MLHPVTEKAFKIKEGVISCLSLYKYLSTLLFQPYTILIQYNQQLILCWRMVIKESNLVDTYSYFYYQLLVAFESLKIKYFKVISNYDKKAYN